MLIVRLFSILLLEGFVTISLEILVIRQLIPYVGNSVIVTSLIIGIFLLFLALGYWMGGQYREKYFHKLRRNFLIATCLMGIGVSTLFIDNFFYYFDAWLIQYELFALSLYLLLVLSPIVFCLGQTIPIMTNLFDQHDRVGQISGKSLFVNTLGSFLGALLTSLLLLNYLGVAWTVVWNCWLLLLLCVIVSNKESYTPASMGIFCMAAYFIYGINVLYENDNFIRTNNYANYQVLTLNDPTRRIFSVNRSASSTLYEQKKGAAYIEYVKTVLFKTLGLRNKAILIIGAGGFTFSAEGTFNNQITYLDIDRDIKTIAEKHFLKEKINGGFIGQDARTFLKHHRQDYDVILSDVYKHRENIPSYLLTKEYFLEIRQALTPEGIAVFNIIADPLLRDSFSKRVDNTILSVYPNCVKIPQGFHRPLDNIIYICALSGSEQDTTAYTDDRNSATLDQFLKYTRDPSKFEF